MILSEEQVVGLTNGLIHAADFIYQIPFIKIGMFLAIIVTVIRIIGDVRAEKDIRAGMDEKTACKYHRKIIHKKKEKEEYQTLRKKNCQTEEIEEVGEA